jgi:hypothetical protein
MPTLGPRLSFSIGLVTACGSPELLNVRSPVVRLSP